MGKTNIISLFSILAVLLIAGCASMPTQQSDTLKFGVMAPLTGDAAAYGLSVQKGIDLAKKNLGLDIELIYEDSKCDAKEAVTAINKLISLDGVQAIIGELCSGATLASSPIANQNKVVIISAASTSPKITDEGPFTFRTVPSDALQGAFGSQLVFDQGNSRLAILYSNEEYGVGFNGVLLENFGALGGEIVASEAFERGATDLRTQITKIKEADPDALYIISNSPDSAVAALKQIKELGVEVALYGSEGLKSQTIIDGAEGAAEGLILTSVSFGNAAFFAAHNVEYGEDPGPFAAQAYDAFSALALAVQQGAKTGSEIKDALATIEFDGASGNMAFDSNGDIAGNYDVFTVVDNKFAQS